MTTDNSIMSLPAASMTAASIVDAVDDVARRLYRRARTAGPEFAETATEVRSLHTVLKYLLIEAEDADSALSHDAANAAHGNSLYARRLMPILAECDTTLQELETMLQKYGATGSEGAEDQGHVRTGAGPAALEGRERDMIARIQSKLAACKTDIDIYLATVQLHYPARTRQTFENADGQQMDAIKDKVDAIARRLFRRGEAGGNDNEEELWLRFRSELEREGFSSEVLWKNGQVLRAYIRELDLHGYLESENPPSVRGLLDHQPTELPSMAITPASYPGPQNGGYLQNGHPPQDQQYSRELQPHQSQSYQPPSTLHPEWSSGLPYERSGSSSDDDSSDTAVSPDLALIRTCDLMSLDRREAEFIASRMGSMYLSPQFQLPPPKNYSVSPGSSPSSRYLMAGPLQPIPIRTGQTPNLGLPMEHQLSSSPGSQQLIGLSPRYVPPILMPGYGGPAGMHPPPAGSFSPSSPSASGPLAVHGTSPGASGAMAAPLSRQYSRLDPDSQGKEIPLDATWTKIKRTLVSTVVLERAGVRYEARPEFVAVLGVLSREQVAEYARQSEAVRRARRPSDADGSRRRSDERDKDGSRRQDPLRHGPATSNGGGHRRKRREQSGSESDVLWDESDTDVEGQPHRRRSGAAAAGDDKKKSGSGAGAGARASSARDKYTPKTFIDGGADRDSSDDKGTRVYPVIVNPPGLSMSGANGGNTTSPSATTQPRSILKNKNENHVRFDEDGPKEISQADLRREKEDEERHRRRRQERRDGKGSHGSDRGKNQHGGGSGRRDGNKNSQTNGTGSSGKRRQDRAIKKSVWGETLGAVGIGSAAASLLSVLTEAAAEL